MQDCSYLGELRILLAYSCKETETESEDVYDADVTTVLRPSLATYLVSASPAHCHRFLRLGSVFPTGVSVPIASRGMSTDTQG